MKGASELLGWTICAKSLMLSQLAVCWLSYKVHSQQVEKPPEKISSAGTKSESYKWDAGLDLYRLFRSGSGNVMLRYSPDKRGAYRLSVGMLDSGTNKFEVYQDSLGNSSIDPYVVKMVGTSIDIRTGYEFHKNVGRGQLFYGLDAQAYYSYNHVKPSTILPSQMYVLSVLPFAGIKYRILDRLSISAETTASLSFRVLQNLDFEKNIVAIQKGYYLALVPLRAINISYHF